MISDQLISYIKNEFAKGKSANAIAEAVAEQGWQERMVNEHMDAVKADPEFSRFFQPAAVAPAPKSRPRMMLAVLAAVILAAAGTGGYFLYRHTKDKASDPLAIPANAKKVDMSGWTTYASLGSPNYTVKLSPAWTIRGKEAITFVKISDKVTLTINRALNTTTFTAPFDDSVSGPDSDVPVNVETTIGGNRAKYVEIHGAAGKEWEEYILNADIVKDTTAWNLTYMVLQSVTAQDMADHKAVFLDILSTFKPN